MTSRPPTSPKARPVAPALDSGGPLRLGLTALALTIVALATAAVVPVSSGPVTIAQGRVNAEPLAIRHADGGVIARMHVKSGDDVDAGALIATLDTRLIDSQIAGLKTQVEAIRLRVSGLKQEADALAANDRLAIQRQRVAGLQSQMSDFEQEALGLEVRLAMAGQERQRTDLRSPARGRITRLFIAEGASVAAQGIVAELQPAADRLLLDAAWPSADSRDVRPGDPVNIWPADAALWAAPIVGYIDQHQQTPTDKASTLQRLRIVVELAGTPLTQSDAAAGERRFTIQLVKATSSLLAHVLAPAVATQLATAHPSNPQRPSNEAAKQ